MKPLEHYFTNNENLKSEIKKLSYTWDNYVFSFLSDNGVFSKNKIDYGSLFLLETYLKNKTSNPTTFLDLGCGYGFIGICLSKITGGKGTLVDVNKRATDLTAYIPMFNYNYELNFVSDLNKLGIVDIFDANKADCECFVSNVYEEVKNKYDLIITNPPIRAGKQVLLDILGNAKDHLNPNGECWFVMRVDHGVKTMIKLLSETYDYEIIDKKKGFYVVSLKIK